MCGQTNIGSFAIETFGCKLNQYESELIRERFIKRGWVEVDFNDKADVYVINTCTVTQKSDARGRNAVRRARRNNPAAMIIVTGCSIETKQDSVLKMSEIDFSIGNKGKTMIPEIAELLLRGEQVDKDRLQLTSDINSHMMIESFFEHARAFIKVQEGCNFSCSYCIIPKARGRSRSVEARHVVDQVKLLREKGYHEVVLTGIHIGRYGLDFEKKMRLSDLIEMILDKVEGVRLRLSSIEINEIDDKLLNFMNESEYFASHLHIPLQSGSDKILKLMRRPYDVESFSERINEIGERVENVAIGTDIIVGFPGEDDNDFQNTYELVSNLPINYFHVFSYSPRPGTDAASYPFQVNPETKKRRSKKLISLGRKKRNLFIRSQIGRRHKVLVQGLKKQGSRFMRSLTENYCEVYIKCEEALKGRLIDVKVSSFVRGKLYGTVIEDLGADLENLNAGR